MMWNRRNNSENTRLLPISYSEIFYAPSSCSFIRISRVYIIFLQIIFFLEIFQHFDMLSISTENKNKTKKNTRIQISDQRIQSECVLGNNTLHDYSSDIWYLPESLNWIYSKNRVKLTETHLIGVQIQRIAITINIHQRHGMNRLLFTPELIFVYV